MANIPVERKGGIPGWVWLLLGLLLVILLFFLLGDGCGNDVDDLVVTDTTSYVEPAPVTPTNDLDFTGPADIEQLNMLFANADPSTIVGKSVRFNDVTATNVTGDSTFYVSDGTNQAFVVLEGMGESQSGGGCEDGRYCIREGDKLDITGRVRALDETARSKWTIRPEAAQGYYVAARRVDD